jgi:hypothetical protein
MYSNAGDGELGVDPAAIENSPNPRNRDKSRYEAMAEDDGQM